MLACNQEEGAWSNGQIAHLVPSLGKQAVRFDP